MPRRSCSRSSAPSTSSNCCRKRHPRVRQVHSSPSELATWCRGAGLRPRCHARPRPTTRSPAATALSRRRERQLPRRLSQARHDARPGGRAAQRRSLRSRRHPDRQRPRPGRAPATIMRVARGLPPLPYAHAAAGWSAAGARGMVGVGFGRRPYGSRVRRATVNCARSSLRRYAEARMTQRHRTFSPRVPRAASQRSQATRSWPGASSPTRPARFSRAGCSPHLGFACSAGGAGQRRHDAARQAASGAAARGRSSTSAWRFLGDCIYVGDDRRDVEAGSGRCAWQTVAAAWGYLGAGRSGQGVGCRRRSSTARCELLDLLDRRRSRRVDHPFHALNYATLGLTWLRRGVRSWNSARRAPVRS